MAKKYNLDQLINEQAAMILRLQKLQGSFESPAEKIEKCSILVVDTCSAIQALRNLEGLKRLKAMSEDLKLINESIDE